MKYLKWPLKVLALGMFLYWSNSLVSDFTPKEKSEQVYETLQKESQAESNLYAWLRVEGTRIDYPVLQHPSDDSYYLSHDKDGVETYYGAIFTELVNTKTFEDPVTIIYGHAIQDGSMFGSLEQFLDSSFFEQHTSIQIEVLDRIYTYDIIGAHPYTDGHLYHEFNLSSLEGLRTYLTGLEERSLAYGGQYRQLDLDLNQGRFLILSTCDASFEDKRLLVTACLHHVEERSHA